MCVLSLYNMHREKKEETAQNRANGSSLKKIKNFYVIKIDSKHGGKHTVEIAF